MSVEKFRGKFNVLIFLLLTALGTAVALDLSPGGRSVQNEQYNWQSPIGNCTLFFDVKEASVHLHSAVASGNLAAVKEILEDLVNCSTNGDRKIVLEHRNSNDNTGRTPLAEAAMGGYFDVIAYLVKQMSANVYAKDDARGCLPIHLAAEKGSVDVVRFFLDNAPDLLEAQNNASSTPLFVATAAGKLAVVRFLVENKSANVETRGESFRTPLMQACAMGNVEIVRFLVEDANASLIAAENDRSRNTAIHVAAENGRLAVVSYLLDRKPELLEVKTQLSDTILNRAALRGRVEIVKFLCENKTANVENRDSLGRTPLLNAVTLSSLPENTMLEVVRVLINHGADPHVKDFATGSTALHLATEINKTEVVGYFLRKFPDLLEVRNYNNETALIRAVIGGELNVVEFLVENCSGNIEARGSLGRTPLMYAASRGDLETVRYLLSRNASINATDEPRGNMAHHLAAAFGQLPILHYLLDKHPELIETRTFINDTAMNAAASGGFLNVMAYLLDDKKANIENRGYRGTTPFLRAVGNGRLLAVQFLFERGANPNATTDPEFNEDTAMHLAATYNQLLVTRFLLTKCSQLLLVKNRLGQTPLDVALVTNSTDVARLLKQTILAMIAVLQRQQTIGANRGIAVTTTAPFLTTTGVTALAGAGNNSRNHDSGLPKFDLDHNNITNSTTTNSTASS